MLFEAKFEKCILCLERPPDSREHLIPACVGGTLEALILCTPCNSKFGSDFVSQLKKDPTIRIAVQHLKGRIPEFASEFEKGLEFHAEGAGSVAVEVSRKGDTWKTKARKMNANDLIMDTEEVPEYIRNTLKKQGLSEPEIKSWVNRFAACENGEQLQLPTGDILIKNETTDPLPKLTEGFVDNRVPVLIAFEFLALCIGNSILGPDFDAVRQYIRCGMQTKQIEVLNKTSRKYDPAHTVRFHVENGTLAVFVQFFRWYVFEVRFRHISMPSKEIVYVEDVENKQRQIALSPEDARQGNWTVF